MSHTLFRHASFSDVRVRAFLKQVDAAEAELCRSSGCPYCGELPRNATYPQATSGVLPVSPCSAGL